jgi:hypothetical protein
MRAEFQSLRAQASAPSLAAVDPQIYSAVIQHCCVRAVGVTENSIKGAILNWCRLRAPAGVTRYVHVNLQSFYNPKFRKLVELIGFFSEEGRINLEVIATQDIRDSLDSLVNNKNKIAHGLASQLGVVSLRSGLDAAERVCQFFEEHFR